MSIGKEKKEEKEKIKRNRYQSMIQDLEREGN